MENKDNSYLGNMDIAKNINWTDKLEDYFASTGEKAHCLGWIHKRAEALYSSRRTWIDLPVIIGSGLIAFLNAGSTSLFDDQKTSSIALGIGSLAVGIMNTMGTYFGWAKKSEGHRICSIHYAKLYRFIYMEMSLPRNERMSPHDLLRNVRDQYDRLAETSPLIPPEVIKEFQTKFAHEEDISKPEEANGLEKIEIFRGEGPNGEPIFTQRMPPPALRQRSTGSVNTLDSFASPVLKSIKTGLGLTRVDTKTQLKPIEEEIKNKIVNSVGFKRVNLDDIVDVSRSTVKSLDNSVPLKRVSPDNEDVAVVNIPSPNELSK